MALTTTQIITMCRTQIMGYDSKTTIFTAIKSQHLFRGHVIWWPFNLAILASTEFEDSWDQKILTSLIMERF